MSRKDCGSWVKDRVKYQSESRSTRSFQEISEFELCMLGKALSNLSKEPTQGILVQRKSKAVRDRLRENWAVSLCEVVNVVVYDKDMVEEAIETQVVWEGYLLVGHLFKNFLQVFLDIVNLRGITKPRNAARTWKRIMAKGNPKLRCRGNLDGILNHQSLLKPYIAGVVPLPKHFDLPKREQLNRNNVYSKIKRRQMISLANRRKAKKQNDLKGARSIKINFKKRFNSERVEARLLQDMISNAVEDMEPAKQLYFKIFQNSIFQQFVIGFAILKNRVDSFVSQKLGNMFRRLFGCQLINDTEDLEFFPQALSVVIEMFVLLRPVSKLFSNLQGVLEENETTDVYNDGFSNLPLEFIGTFVADLGDNIFVDLFTGSIFREKSSGKLELLELRGNKSEEYLSLPKAGDVFDKPAIVLPVVFAYLQKLFENPRRSFTLYREQWMMINMDLIHRGIVNAVLNNNAEVLTVLIDMELPEDVVKTSKTFKGMSGVRDCEDADVAHKYNAEIHPVVRTDMHFSSVKQKKGNRGNLLKICILLNNFDALKILTKHGLSLESKFFNQRSTSLHWVSPLPFEKFTDEQDFLRVKLSSSYEESDFIDLIFENLLNTISIKDSTELENFETKLNIFKDLKKKIGAEVSARTLFQAYLLFLDEFSESELGTNFCLIELEKLTLERLSKSEGAYEYFSRHALLSTLNKSNLDSATILMNILDNGRFDLLKQSEISVSQIHALLDEVLSRIKDGDCSITSSLQSLSFLLSNYNVEKKFLKKLCKKIILLPVDNFISDAPILETLIPIILPALSDEQDIFCNLFIKLFRFDFILMKATFKRRLNREEKVKVLQKIVDLYFAKVSAAFSHLLLPSLKELSPKGFFPLKMIFTKLMNRKIYNNNHLRLIYELTNLYPSFKDTPVQVYKTFLVKLFLIDSFTFEKNCLVDENEIKPLMCDLIRVKILHQTCDMLFGEHRKMEEGRATFREMLKSLRKLAKRYKKEGLWYDGIIYFIKLSNDRLELNEELGNVRAAISRISRYIDKKAEWEIDFDPTSESCVFLPNMC